MSDVIEGGKLPDPEDAKFKAAVTVLRARGYSLAEVKEVFAPKMSLRDWFAGQALAAGCTGVEAYRLADEALAARSTQTQGDGK